MAKIAIDAGHGLYTPGKRCMKSLDPNETREWVLNDRVADALGEYLKSAGHSILRVDDTDGSTDVSLANRVKKANDWGADAYVSTHHNAAINGGPGGGTVVYVGTGYQPKSVKLQEAVYKHALAEANLKGNRSDGTPAAAFYVLMNTEMPAILIECGYMDSSTDIKYILDANWSKKMGLGIAKGVCEIYGGTVGSTDSISNGTTESNEGVKTVRRLSPGSAHILCDCNIYDETWKKVVVRAKKGDHITILDHGTSAVKVKHNNSRGIMHCKYVMPDIVPGDKLELVEDVTITLKKGTTLVSQDNGYLGNIVSGNFLMDAAYVQKVEKK